MILNMISVDSSKLGAWHCGLFREYVDMEFRSLADHPDVNYDLERIIDDYYMLVALLNNRYLPSLPDLDIHRLPMNILLEAYRTTLPQLGGYITDYGKINFDRLELLLFNLASLENKLDRTLWEDQFSKTEANRYGNTRQEFLKWFQTNTLDSKAKVSVFSDKLPSVDTAFLYGLCISAGIKASVITQKELVHVEKVIQQTQDDEYEDDLFEKHYADDSDMESDVASSCDTEHTLNTKYGLRTFYSGADNYLMIKFTGTIAFHKKAEHIRGTMENWARFGMDGNLRDQYKAARESPTFRDDVNRYYYEVRLLMLMR
jgi:5'-3' exonuclease